MKLGIILLTAHRLEYARRTLAAMGRNLSCSGGELLIHIGDDGSGDEYMGALLEEARTYWPGATITTSDSGGRGYGANYNLATQQMHQLADYVLPVEDDWELTRPFDAQPIIDFLEQRQDMGCVRLGYIGWTQPLRGEFVSGVHRIWLHLDPQSEEPHVFAGHPRIERVAWARKVGPWPEDLNPGATEFAVAHYPEARTGVVWPVDLLPPSGNLFAHIGTIRSYAE